MEWHIHLLSMKLLYYAEMFSIFMDGRVLLRSFSLGCRSAMSDLRSYSFFCIFIMLLMPSLTFSLVRINHLSFKKIFCTAGKDDDAKSNCEDYWAASLGFVELLPISSKIRSSMLFKMVFLFASAFETPTSLVILTQV